MTTEPARPADLVADLGSTPGVIPYVESHAGPRRVLTVDLTVGNSSVLSRWYPVVSVDGRQYVVVPGPVSWEIPADRNVHVSAHIEGQQIFGEAASVLLSPGEERVILVYSTRGGAGSLTEAPR